MPGRPDRFPLTVDAGAVARLSRICSSSSLLPSRPPPGSALVAVVAAPPPGGVAATVILARDPACLEPIDARIRVLYLTIPAVALAAAFPGVDPAWFEEETP